MKPSRKQPWLHNAAFDSGYILLPPFLALIIVMLLPAQYRSTDAMPLTGWIILVLLIDVAHVYSTLFRTYFDKERFRQRRMLFTLVPIACYLAGVAIYSISALLFWRLLAYLAVFHFIRQQYGFMRLYARTEQHPRWMRIVDTLTIYTATLYPSIYWHLSPGRNFSWFIKDDFLSWESAGLRQAATVIYAAILALYLLKEAIGFAKHRHLNAPRNLLILGTALSWYAGIVYFNGDMAFTLLNVVAHGIPYMALIWLLTRREQKEKPRKGINPHLLRSYGIALFLGIIVVLAYLEEGLWDGLVWREHGQLFALFRHLPAIEDASMLALLVPLLSLPQSTHYVLDGFIWRKKDGAVAR
jgi:hypothetical protein